jgi:hypothetical protein
VLSTRLSQSTSYDQSTGGPKLPPVAPRALAFSGIGRPLEKRPQRQYAQRGQRARRLDAITASRIESF